MFTTTFLAVVVVRVQHEPTVTGALVTAEGVATLVLTPAVVLGTFVHVYVVSCRETGSVD